MRLRAANGLVVSVLLASVGCGQTRGVSDTGGGAAGSDDGPPTMALDFAQSGARLVAMGYSSNEAQVFRTFHDSSLGFDCNFVPDAAGVHQRCVPSTTATIVYTDAGCSEPAAWDESTWGQPGWEVGDTLSGIPSGDTSTCPGQAPPHRAAYRVAELLTEEVLGPPSIPLFALNGARCQPTIGPAKITPPVHRLVPMLETELARAERVSLNLGGGLRVTRLVSDDGAELSVGVTGADRTPCGLQRDGECVPEPIAAPPSFAPSGRFGSALNADCTEPAFVSPYSPACGAIRFAVEDDGAAPLKVMSLTKAPALFGWQLVLPVTEELTYACTASAGDGAAPDRDLTGTLPSASRLQRGTGPLRVNWYSVGQSELLPVLADFRRASPGVVPAPEFVTDAGLPCQIMQADDGTERCAVVDEAGRPIGDLASAPEVVWGAL